MRNELREKIAVVLAETFTLVRERQPDEPVDVAKVHREIAEHVVAAILDLCEPKPGEMHEIDRAFHDLTTKERDYERTKATRLERERAELVAGDLILVRRIDLRTAAEKMPMVYGHEDWEDRLLDAVNQS